MSYRIITRSKNTQTEAKTDLKKLKDKVRNPIIVQSEKNNGWFCVLYESITRENINKAFIYFRNQNIECFIQQIKD